MPLNFLELSPSYCKHATAKARERRTFLCERYFRDDYGLKGRDASLKAVGDLCARGIETTRPVICADSQLFRAASEFLQAPPDKQASIRAEVERAASSPKQPIKLFGVRCLLADGITTWADIERLKQPEPPAEAGAEEVEAEKESAATADTPPGVVVELPVSTLIEVRTLASQVTASLAGISTVTQGLIDQLMADRDRLTQRAEFLESQNSLLRAELANQAQVVEQSRAQVQGWEKYGEELLREAEEAHDKTLLELAERIGAQSDLGREVLIAVQRFAEDEKRRRAEMEAKTVSEALSGVVTKGRYSGLRTMPEPKFVADFLALQNGEQKAIREAMKRFCEEGPEYPSFQTHVITDDTVEILPPKCSSSRASDELRLFWRQEEDGIHFYRIARKGDRSFFKSEA